MKMVFFNSIRIKNHTFNFHLDPGYSLNQILDLIHLDYSILVVLLLLKWYLLNITFVLNLSWSIVPKYSLQICLNKALTSLERINNFSLVLGIVIEP